MSLDISVRRSSVRALGLLAVYDKNLMMENLELINKVRRKIIRLIRWKGKSFSWFFHWFKVVENDASVVVIEGLHALGDMFIRHNAHSLTKNPNTTRGFVQSIEKGFRLIAQMIDSRVSWNLSTEKNINHWMLTDSQCSLGRSNKYYKIIFCRSNQ